MHFRNQIYPRKKNIGSEFHILLEASLDEIKQQDNLLAKAIDKMRKADIVIEPGYDGVFGTVKIFTKQEKDRLKPKQKTLF